MKSFLQEKKNMINRITDEMKKCVENECYIAALALALTLPDTCGKAEYPLEKSTKKRYIDWYNEYIGKYEKSPNEDFPLMPYANGEIVYSLRCQLLHQGTPDIEQKNVKEERCKVDHFSLTISDPSIGGSSHVTYNMNNVVERRELEINIVNLSSKLGAAAKSYYRENPDKFDFIQYDLKDVRHAYDTLFTVTNC